MTKSILVIEDDKLLNQLLVSQLGENGFLTRGVNTWREAQDWLATNSPDVILLDKRLPDANGEELIPELSIQFPVIMLTAYGSVRQAVEAIHAGAADYLTKPVNPDELGLVINRVLETESLRQRFQVCKNMMRNRKHKLLVGHSDALAEVERMIEAVAPSDMTVLIHGESGVGKELVAHEVHEHSDRRESNFIALDCCTIQESLFESELFGHEKGAFTGADRRKKGLIEAAEGGTLFLDEIGEISPPIQAKLLRFLETGNFRRVGGSQDLTSNARIVAATNRNLEEMVRNREFRADLLYRLNAFTIVIPPLREHREDIPDLVLHFISNHNFSRRISKRVTKAAMRELIAYDWPGNVRELRNVVERAIILSRDLPDIRPEHLAFSNSGSHKTGLGTVLQFDGQPSLEQIEKTYLTMLLEKYSGHRGKVAKAMGVSERNIYRLIDKHGLNRIPPKPGK